MGGLYTPLMMKAASAGLLTNQHMVHALRVTRPYCSPLWDETEEGIGGGLGELLRLNR